MPIFLVVVKGPQEVLGQRLVMPKAVSTIGSAPNVDLCLPAGLGVEPLHARAWLDGRDMIVEGLEGLTIISNGVRAPLHRILLNQTFFIGTVIELRFEYIPSRMGMPAPVPVALPPSSQRFPMLADVPSTVLRKTPLAGAPEEAGAAAAAPAGADQRPTFGDRAGKQVAPAAPVPDVAAPALSGPTGKTTLNFSVEPVSLTSAERPLPEPPPKTSMGMLPAAQVLADKLAPPKPAAPAAPVATAPVAPVAPPAPKAKDAVPAAKPATKAAERVLAEIRLETGEPLSVEELQGIKIFEGIPVNQIARLPGAVVRRRFRPGEFICREGEYGSTAFYILSGQAEVFIGAPLAHVKSEKKDTNRGGFLGVLSTFTHRLAKRTEDPRAEADEGARYIRIDGPDDLPMDNPIARMNPGDLFGEMSCLSFYPRSASVRAKDDCVMLEMLRPVLQVLQKNAAFKAQLEQVYRERALGQHLRSVPILAGLDDSFVNQLRDRVKLVFFEEGEAVVTQGEPADAFYLIRLGTVKVTQRHAGGEMVLTYLGRGDFFGEMGLLKGGKRTATCVALDHIELVKIEKPDFDFMLSWYENVREAFEKKAAEREAAGREMVKHAPGISLDEFLGQGLMHAQSLLVLDLEKCTRCDECVRACADSHDGITRLVREGLRFERYLIATSCRSCLDPVCMIGCPVGSIRRKESLEIVIEDWCIGCGICAKQCPYGNITMHRFEGGLEGAGGPGAGGSSEGGAESKKAAPKPREKAVTCDLCTDLAEPSCVYACPHDAAHRVNARSHFLGFKG